MKDSNICERGVKNFSELFLLRKSIFELRRCLPHKTRHAVGNLSSHMLRLLRELEIKDLPFCDLFPAHSTSRHFFLSKADLQVLADTTQHIAFPTYFNRVPRVPLDWNGYKINEQLFFFMADVPFLFQPRKDKFGDILHSSIRHLLLIFSYLLHYRLCDRYPPDKDLGSVIESRAVAASRMARDLPHMANYYLELPILHTHFTNCCTFPRTTVSLAPHLPGVLLAGKVYWDLASENSIEPIKLWRKWGQNSTRLGYTSDYILPRRKE